MTGAGKGDDALPPGPLEFNKRETGQMSEKGLSEMPKPLLENGETVSLKDGRSIYVGRWTARKAMQVAKFLASVADYFQGDALEKLKVASPVLIAKMIIDAAEDKAFAFVDMCLRPEDKSRVAVADLDYIDFIQVLQTIIKVNLQEDDRKKLMGLVALSRGSATGPSSILSSPR